MEISEELDQHVQAGETEVTDSETNLTDTTINLDNSNLSMEQKERLNELISQNMDAFAVSMHNLGKTELHYHRIDTGNARPVAQRFYRTSPKMQCLREKDQRRPKMVLHGLHISCYISGDNTSESTRFRPYIHCNFRFFCVIDVLLQL